MRSWTPAETNDFLSQNTPDSLQLLDVRENWEYERVSLPGSLLIPLGQLHVTANLEQLEKSKPVAIICHHGVRSAHACYLLEKMGFDTINISGGIDLWARELDPQMAIY